MASDGLLLLDTNVLVHLLRADAAGRWLDKNFNLSGRTRHLLSVISIGEVLRLAELWAWGAPRRDQVHELISAFVVVDIHHVEILESYARLGVHWERQGLRLEQNDLWIAATVDNVDATLLTLDNDFKKIESMIDVEWVDPEFLKTL